MSPMTQALAFETIIFNGINMDKAILAAVISPAVALLSILVAYLQWRRDVKIKLRKLREEVDADLVRSRIAPYSVLLKSLEPYSQVHAQKLQGERELANGCFQILHNALYGEVGLLASHQTRYIIGLARECCRRYSVKQAYYDMFIKHLWAVHTSMRSDVGISQKSLGWPSITEVQFSVSGQPKNKKIETLIKQIHVHSYGADEKNVIKKKTISASIGYHEHSISLTWSNDGQTVTAIIDNDFGEDNKVFKIKMLDKDI